MVTDRDGKFRFESVPLKKAWRFKMRVPGTSVELESEDLILTRPGLHAGTVTLKTEQSGDGAVKLSLTHDFLEQQSALSNAAKQAEQTNLEIEVLKAEQILLNATERLLFSQRLHAKGYVTQSRITADELAVKQANLELELAKAELRKIGQSQKARDK
jgi:hypothetical protein